MSRFNYIYSIINLNLKEITKKMNTDKYKSVAIKTEIVNRLDKLAQLDVRSIPKTIEFLTNEEYKRRKIQEAS